MSTDFSTNYLREVSKIANEISTEKINSIAEELAYVRLQEGRLFFLGIGGSAGNCSHAVNDFRKICGFEAYAPTDNVSELTARTNDDGWNGIFANWLVGSRISSKDAIFILSVGGGNLEENISPNLVEAIDIAKSVGAKVFGVVGRDGGYTAKSSDTVLIIPTINPVHTTPHAEAFQSVIWHLLVSHPLLKQKETKWESIK